MPRREVIEFVVSGVTDASLPQNLSDATAQTQHYIDFLAQRGGRPRDAVWRDVLAGREVAAARKDDSKVVADLVARVRGRF